MTPLRSCVARPSIGTGDTVAQGSLHCKEHRELQMPRPQCTQVAPPEAGAQRSVAPSTSVDSPCSSSCSNSAEDSCKSGRSGRVDLKNRTEKRRNRHVWMNCRVIRDREAPGSNPGPPTKQLLFELAKIWQLSSTGQCRCQRPIVTTPVDRRVLHETPRQARAVKRRN